MSCKIFIGNLPYDIREREIDDAFYRYGRVRDIRVNKNGFAFVTYDHPRDADDALRDMDGRTVFGRKIRVELSERKDRDGRGDRKDKQVPRGEFAVLFENLPERTSWQDLKDLARKAGEVAFTKVENGGPGVAEYTDARSAEEAVKIFDNTDYKGSMIRVVPGSNQKSTRRSRSPPNRERSRSRSPRRGSRSPPRRNSPRRNSPRRDSRSPRGDSPRRDSRSPRRDSPRRGSRSPSR